MHYRLAYAEMIRAVDAFEHPSGEGRIAFVHAINVFEWAVLVDALERVEHGQAIWRVRGSGLTPQEIARLEMWQRDTNSARRDLETAISECLWAVSQRITTEPRPIVFNGVNVETELLDQGWARLRELGFTQADRVIELIHLYDEDAVSLRSITPPPTEFDDEAEEEAVVPTEDVEMVYTQPWPDELLGFVPVRSVPRSEFTRY